MKRVLFAVLVSCSSLAMADRAPGEIYPKACAVCHAAGVANAPKLGDAAAWKTRLDAKGIDGLVQSVNNGLNAMPPKGMCMDCTPGEYKAVIEYMIKGS